MPLVRKIDPEWAPSENPTLGVGEEIEISDPGKLVDEGKVELVKAPAPKKGSAGKTAKPAKADA